MNSIDSAVSSVISAQQAAVSAKISTAIAAKQLNAQKQLGEAAVALVDSAARLSREPGKGTNFDALV